MGLLGDAIGALTGKDAQKAADAQVGASKEAMGAINDYYGRANQSLAPYSSVGRNALFQLSGLYGGPSELESQLEQTQNTFYDRMRDQKGGLEGVNNIFGWSSPEGEVDWANITDDQIGKYKYAENRADLRRMRDLSRQINEQGEQAPDYSAFTESPGYQFRLQEGANTVQNSAAAQGMLNSGTALKALEEYGQNYASNEYGNYVNQLMNMAGMGQGAATNQAQLSASQGNALADLQTGIGNARASGYVGQGNALRSLIGQGTQAAAMAFSDVRLKRNIEQVGATPGGLPLYRFRYLWSDDVYEGVMAQDVEKVLPDAVVEIGGYKAVDYSKVH